MDIFRNVCRGDRRLYVVVIDVKGLCSGISLHVGKNDIQVLASNAACSGKGNLGVIVSGGACHFAWNHLVVNRSCVGGLLRRGVILCLGRAFVALSYKDFGDVVAVLKVKLKVARALYINAVCVGL